MRDYARGASMPSLCRQTAGALLALGPCDYTASSLYARQTPPQLRLLHARQRLLLARLWEHRPAELEERMCQLLAVQHVYLPDGEPNERLRRCVGRQQKRASLRPTWRDCAPNGSYDWKHYAGCMLLRLLEEADAPLVGLKPVCGLEYGAVQLIAESFNHPLFRYCAIVRRVTEVLRHLAIDYSLDDAGRLKDPALLTPRACRRIGMELLESVTGEDFWRWRGSKNMERTAVSTTNAVSSTTP